MLDFRNKRHHQYSGRSGRWQAFLSKTALERRIPAGSNWRRGWNDSGADYRYFAAEIYPHTIGRAALFVIDYFPVQLAAD